ncbi:DUF1398 family protein [Horticoccus luteus]|uniref:DUF1398 family protein n=1 Tax=Horticoccus luteus TaxID=2862869 RepID=A0A8F9XMC4_9BACT|nr:DUF1398 family protein [Horticoccus luteus]QYM80096.1 DUF1398 family protein [Horticoccus luteus]
MNIDLIQSTAARVLAGAASFPEVVHHLLAAGVETYHVDYVARRKTFYAGGSSEIVVTPIDFPELPEIAPDFDKNAVKAAIVASQRDGQSYHDFTRRVLVAGVQGYCAFLRGKRVIYFGRQGDLHTEWFPGAQAASRL